MLDRIAPALFVILWSTGWVVAKLATIFTGPLTFLSVRYATAIVLFYMVCRIGGAVWPKDRVSVWHAMVSGMFLHGIYLGMVWWAIGQGVPAALSGIIAGLQPLLTGLAATSLLGERLSPLQKAGLGIGFAGIAIAVAPKLFAADMGVGGVPAYAIIVNVVGMAAVTAGTLYQKRYLERGDIRAIAVFQYVGALCITLPFALALEDRPIEFGFGFFATLAWSVIGISMGAVALLLYLIRRGQVSRAASLIYLVPPLAAVEAAIIFGEPLTWPMVLGTVIVGVGVYLTNRSAAQVQRKAQDQRQT